MANPFPFLPDEWQCCAFWISLAACFAVLLVMTQLGPGEPAALVEAATNQNQLDCCLADFASTETRAVWKLAVDFLLIPAYVLATGLACVLMAQKFGGGVWATLGFGLAAGLYLAGAADVIENILVLITILSAKFNQTIIFAARCATCVKWTFFGAGASYAIVTLIYGLARMALRRFGTAT